MCLQLIRAKNVMISLIPFSDQRAKYEVAASGSLVALASYLETWVYSQKSVIYLENLQLQQRQQTCGRLYIIENL